MTPVATMAALADLGVKAVSLACGNFDGVHLGHQAIFAQAVADANDAVTPVVLTFDPHPRRLLRPDQAPPLILTMEHRLALMPRYGIQQAVVMPFTDAVAALAPEEFLKLILTGPVEVTAISVGTRWRFGQRAAGGIELLASIGQRYGVTVHAVEEVRDGTAVISSTRIRQALAQGDLETCSGLLGRPYSVRGEVIRGHGFASEKIGVPTANVACRGELLPPPGIYVAVASVNDGPLLPGICYFGSSPTMALEERDPVVEVHLYDRIESLYGQIVEVSFLEFVRSDEKFPDLNTLRSQITADMREVRQRHVRSGRLAQF